MSSGSVERLNISGFSQMRFVADDSPNACALMVTEAGGKELILTMSLVIAGQIHASISAALQQIEKEQGLRVLLPATPERILRYNAERSRDEPHEVLIYLDGERANPLLGRMTPIGARSLAALLMVAAEHGDEKPAN